MSIAWISLIIFIFCIVLFIWDKLPMATTALLGCALMVIFQVCDFSTAFGQYASSTVILTIGVMIIGASISETGLASWIGNKIVAISSGSEIKLIIGTYIASALMSAFLTNSAVLAIFIPIIMGLSSDKSNIKTKNLIMPIAIGCVLGGTTTLVGSTQQMTAQGLLAEIGAQTFNMFDFTLVGGIITFIGLVYILLFGYKRGKKIWGDNDQIDEDSDSPAFDASQNQQKSKMIIMIIIFAFTVVFYISEWLPIAITSSVGAILCIVTRCIPQKVAFQKVNWNIVFRLGGCLGLASALEAAGGTELIANGFSKIVGNRISPFLLFCLIVLLTQVASEFISNSTALLIVLPIVLSIAPSLGLNPYTFALGATLGSGVALSCPLASSTLGMSMTVGYKFKDYFKYSFPMDVIGYIVIICLVPLIYGLTL